MSKTRKQTDTASAYDDLGELVKWNLSLLPKEEVIDRGYFENIEIKKAGGTVGKIVGLRPQEEDTESAIDFDLEDIEEEIVEGKEDKEAWMLKKSGRTQIDGMVLKRGGDPKIKKSSGMTVKDWRAGAAESFNEKCAAELFSTIKQVPEYLPKIVLVKSDFETKDKPYNTSKKNSLKVYVASKIIGDYRKINDERESGHNARLLDERRPLYGADTRKEAIDDVCENAVIMFLLSNYDIKLNNFVNPENHHNWLVPIDFGHARYEEKYSADIYNGIDLLRRARAGTTNKVISSGFANEALKGHFLTGENYIMSQSFYYKYLKPSHFLGVIEKINSDPDIETKLWNKAFKYTFGTPEEKQRYAEIVITRVRELVKLKPILQTSADLEEKEPGYFSERNLRDIVSESEEFENDLKNTNHSKGKEFFRTISGIFDQIKEDEENIVSALDEYGQADESDKALLNDKILKQVHDFNKYVKGAKISIEDELSQLEEEYRDSDYVSSNITHDGSWISYKSKIKEHLDELFDTLVTPLDNQYEGSDSDDDKSYEYKSDSENESENESDSEYESENESDSEYKLENENDYENDLGGSENEYEEELDEAKIPDVIYDESLILNPPRLERSFSDSEPDWDLTGERHKGYKKNLEILIDKVSDFSFEIELLTKEIITHIGGYDTLQQVKKENHQKDPDLIERTKKSFDDFKKPSASTYPKSKGEKVRSFKDALAKDDNKSGTRSLPN